MNNKQSSSSGISFFALLALVFIVLKLCNVIAWSWWLVLAPLWIPFVLGLVCIILIALFSKW